MNLSPISANSPLPPTVQTPVPISSNEIGSTSAGNITFVTPPPAVAADKVAAATISVNPQAVPQQSLDKAVEEINRFLRQANTSVEFSVDQDSGRTLVQVIDSDTKDVIRQFPSKEALSLSHELDKLQGLLLREKA